MSKLLERMESVTVRGQKRAIGLCLFTRVFALTRANRKAYIDSLAWFNTSLRDGKPNDVVHYLDDLKGCGVKTEKTMAGHFFEVLKTVVEQLSKTGNSEKEVVFFLHSLRWRFSGRDHSALA